MEVDQAKFGEEVKLDEVPTLPVPNCPAEAVNPELPAAASTPPELPAAASTPLSPLQLQFNNFQKKYPKYAGFRAGREGREIEAPLGGGAKFRQDLDEHFRPLMNERILHESTELKQKLEALYAEKLEELKVLILSKQDLGLTEEQKKEIDDIFEAYIAETQRQESWFPDVKLYATYMKRSFEDFLQNSTIDFSNNIERDSIQELEDCLLRVKSFGDRKAALTVETCARSYITKIEELN